MNAPPNVVASRSYDAAAPALCLVETPPPNGSGGEMPVPPPPSLATGPQPPEDHFTMMPHYA
jgi:hypothetical protein